MTSSRKNIFKVHKIENTLPLDDPDTLLWRYMDFPSFTSLVLSSSLYFPRVDQMSDAWEAYAAPHPEFLKNSKDTAEQKQKFAEAYQKIAKSQYISCWHMNPNESYAMWKIYDSSDRGIAIQIKAGDLWRSLEAVQVKRPFVMGSQVSYVDYGTPIPFGNSFYPLLAKRKHFEFEHEYRLISTAFPINNEFFFWEGLPTGISQPVDLEILLQSIYISPFAPSWIEKTYRDFLQKFGIACSIKQSTLSELPPTTNFS